MPAFFVAVSRWREYGKDMNGMLWLAGCVVAGAVHAQGMMAPGMSGRGIPGVTRPMLNAGPVMGGMGGGGMGRVIVNPNWIGAAAMFAPQLLMGNGMMNGGGMMNAGMNPGMPAVPAVVPLGEVRRVPMPSVAMASVKRLEEDRGADERLLAFQREQAKAGSPGAQRALARRYAEGIGVEKSEVLAKAWATAADNSERRAAAGE